MLQNERTEDRHCTWLPQNSQGQTRALENWRDRPSQCREPTPLHRVTSPLLWVASPLPTVARDPQPGLGVHSPGCFLHTGKVIGSIPIAPTIKPIHRCQFSGCAECLSATSDGTKHETSATSRRKPVDSVPVLSRTATQSQSKTLRSINLTIWRTSISHPGSCPIPEGDDATILAHECKLPCEYCGQTKRGRLRRAAASSLLKINQRAPAAERILEETF